MANIKVGDSVRVRGATPVGTATKLSGGCVVVSYDHGRGRVTLGSYPEGHVEIVPAKEEEVMTKAQGPMTKTRPSATTKEILP